MGRKELCEAIKKKKIVKIKYTKGKKYPRTVIPYLVGKTATGDALRAYQLSGFSTSEIKEGWRIFLLKDISEVKITDNDMGEIRKDYNPNDKMMKTIYCKI